MIIYKITNRLSGKSYIGQTTMSLAARMRSHRCNRQSTGIDGAIAKYGIDNFLVGAIAFAGSLDELNALEAALIAEHGTLAPNGYNLHTGGNSHACSDATKQRLSDKAKARRHSTETRRRMSEAGKVRGFSESHRLNISAALKGRAKTAEHVARLPQNCKGAMAGELHPRAKLTNEQAAQVKTLIADGLRNKQIERITGIKNSQVGQIRIGRAYASVKV